MGGLTPPEHRDREGNEDMSQSRAGVPDGESFPSH
jgi:hypothetical protein